MALLNQSRNDDGWRQVRAGVSLIACSRLARFDAKRLVFRASEEHEFEFVSGHREVHKEFGRLNAGSRSALEESISQGNVLDDVERALTR